MQDELLNALQAEQVDAQLGGEQEAGLLAWQETEWVGSQLQASRPAEKEVEA
jgi:hypothetical protein